MSVLRVIRQDILWLNSRRPAVRITGLILVVGLIVGGWYLGAEWWNVNGYVPRSGRVAPRREVLALALSVAFIYYVISVIDRGRKRF